MAIPSVVQGKVEFAGKVFEIDSPRGVTWLESVTSFRFESAETNKPYTVRKESGKGGNYWYGYRKVSGKLHKRYIGKSSEISTAKLEEIAEALNVPPEPRLHKVTQLVTDVVTQTVTDTVTRAELVALQSQMEALQQSLETLRSELPGKSDVGDFLELPIITYSELQTELGNLGLENAELRRQLESSDHLVNRRNQEISELNNRLAAANQKISELDDQTEGLESEIQNLKSEIASRPEPNPTPITINLSQKAGDIMNIVKPYLSRNAPKDLLKQFRQKLAD